MSAVTALSAEFKIQGVVIDVLKETDFLDREDIADAVIARLSTKQRSIALHQLLMQAITSQMSKESTSTYVVSDATNTSIKQPGKSWHKKTPWEHHRMNVGPNEWVFWPQFSIENAIAKIDLLSARLVATKTNITWYHAIVATLNKYKVSQISELPAEVRKQLEDMRGTLPDE